MDVNDIRAIITLLSFIAFLAIIFWAYSGRRKSAFEEAANLPFADDEIQQRTIEHDAGISSDSHPTTPQSDRPTGDKHG